MNRLRLRDVPAETYAREVLPQTAKLWAGRRNFATYAAQTLEIARSQYGRSFYRTAALYDGAQMLASFKRYRRTMRVGTRRLRAIGIGAVFTPQAFRGRGYASAMLASELDRARAEGCDVAYLFSDIAPAFYAALGFVELPSRDIGLRADALPATRITFARMEERDWLGVRRCFDRNDRRRAAAFARGPVVWEWMRLRMAHGSERAGGQETNLVVRGRSGAVMAYVLGERDPVRDAFSIEELGFGGPAGAMVLPALLRAAAGDLRRVTGWLPPAGVRDVLSKGVVRKRRRAIFMAAPLTQAGALLVQTMLGCGDADPAWRADHV